MGKPSTTPKPSRTSVRLWIALTLLLVLHAPAQTAVSATTVPLLLPSAIAYDAQGNLYIAETANHDIRKVDTTGNITTIAGTGTQGFSGDNGPATAAELDSPQGLAFDANQNLYIADTHNQRIRKINRTTGTITTIAGTGAAGASGDNGPATSAQLDIPTALAVDTANNLYIADTANHRIREINATTGTITTVAGNGTQGFAGDNGPATSASIDSPTGIAVDAAGSLYLADTHNHRIRKINSTTGIITTIAGTGSAGFTGDNAAASAAALALPHGLTIDAAGNLYLVDTANHRIREINATTGQITTVVGNGTQAFAGDNGPATAASLDSPRAVVTNSATPLTVADTHNQRIRQLDSASPPDIHTIAGLGVTTPGALTLSAPSVATYGTGQITVTLTASTAATGTITFLDLTNGTTATLSTAALSQNTATLSTATLPVGTHNITAAYAGDATHASAQSAAFTLTITPQPLTANVAPITLLYGQPIPPITGTLTGFLPQDAASLSATFTTPATSSSPPNTYPITATLTGPAAGNYALTSSTTLTIKQAPATITFTTSAVTIAPGASLIINASVASTTTGTPTGTLTILDNTTPLTTAQLTPNGQITFTTGTLTTGSHTLTAVYSGDTDFTPTTSTPAIIGVGTVSGTTTGPDFTLATTGTTTQTLLPGSAASFTFTVQMQSTAISSPIALSATGLPSLTTASFNPAYLPPGATSNTFTMTIATPGTAGSKRTPTSPITFALLFLPIAILARRNHDKTKTLLTIAFLTIALTLCSGCGDRIRTADLGAPAAIPYTITVTGTATTPTGTILQHNATVTLLLQQTN